MKFEFSRQIFAVSSNVKFHDNPSGGNRVFLYGKTDRHDEANIAFRNFATLHANSATIQTQILLYSFLKKTTLRLLCDSPLLDDLCIQHMT